MTAAEAEPWKTSECSVCNHAQAAEIDAALIGGTALRTVAGQFAVSRSSVHRHRQNHLSAAPIVDPQDREQREPLKIADVHRQLTGIVDRLERVAETAARNRQPQVVVAAAREMRAAAVEIARLQADDELKIAASGEAVRSEIDKGMGEAVVRLLVAVLEAFSTPSELRMEIARDLVAQCLRRVGTDGYAADFADLDTAAVAAWLEERAALRETKIENAVQRRVEAELRRRANQARPALEGGGLLAIEGGTS